MYLSVDRELHVRNGLRWWFDRKHIYPCLSRMAMDYLSIPGKLTMPFVFYMLTCIPLATSVDVERTFSQGRLLLSPVRSRLSVQSTRALLCVGVWSLLDLVKDEDVNAAAVLPELDGPEDRLVNGWDSLVVD